MKAMEMFDKIKHDIEQDYYREHYPTYGQRFIAWYLRNIHNLDIHEAKDCITDGAGDKQIDAIYIDNQSSTIYIMQGKFYADRKSTRLNSSHSQQSRMPSSA